jgi:hypothetical protein
VVALWVTLGSYFDSEPLEIGVPSTILGAAVSRIGFRAATVSKIVVASLSWGALSGWLAVSLGMSLRLSCPPHLAALLAFPWGVWAGALSAFAYLCLVLAARYVSGWFLAHTTHAAWLAVGVAWTLVGCWLNFSWRDPYASSGFGGGWVTSPRYPVLFTGLAHARWALIFAGLGVGVASAGRLATPRPAGP